MTSEETLAKILLTYGLEGETAFAVVERLALSSLNWNLAWVRERQSVEELKARLVDVLDSTGKVVSSSLEEARALVRGEASQCVCGRIIRTKAGEDGYA